MTTVSQAHAFPRSDRSALGVWWWTVDRWMLGVIGLLIAIGLFAAELAYRRIAKRGTGERQPMPSQRKAA